MVGCREGHCQVDKSVPHRLEVSVSLLVEETRGGETRVGFCQVWCEGIVEEDQRVVESGVWCSLSLATGEDEQPDHREDIDVEKEEDENVEYLREGEFDGLGKFLHDGGREEEDERSEEPAKSESVPERWLIVVNVTRAKPERDKHIREAEDDHDQIEEEPFSLEKPPPAQQVILDSAVDGKEHEADELHGLRDSTRRVVEVEDVVPNGGVGGDAERGGVLKEGQDEGGEDDDAQRPLDPARVVDSVHSQRARVQLVEDGAVVDSVFHKDGCLEDGRLFLRPRDARERGDRNSSW